MLNEHDYAVSVLQKVKSEMFEKKNKAIQWIEDWQKRNVDLQTRSELLNAALSEERIQYNERLKARLEISLGEVQKEIDDYNRDSVTKNEKELDIAEADYLLRAVEAMLINY